jgi:hypothetical protein
MGPPRWRERDSLPRLGARCTRNSDGPVGLRPAGNVAALRCATDRRGWGSRGMALACGGTQPGGGALRGRISRARGEPTCICAATRARRHAPRARRSHRCRLRRARYGRLSTGGVLRAIGATGWDPPCRLLVGVYPVSWT